MVLTFERTDKFAHVILPLFLSENVVILPIFQYQSFDIYGRDVDNKIRHKFMLLF
jgi:hypothetical protein